MNDLIVIGSQRSDISALVAAAGKRASDNVVTHCNPCRDNRRSVCAESVAGRGLKQRKAGPCRLYKDDKFGEGGEIVDFVARRMVVMLRS